VEVGCERKQWGGREKMVTPELKTPFGLAVILEEE
jgi:hypothetical protein